MGSLLDLPDQHRIVALEEQYCSTPTFDLGTPYTLSSYSKTLAEDVATRIRDATIILMTTLPLTTQHLSSECTPHLRMIAVMASGTDHIDLQACRRRGIVVCNASKANVPAVSEHAIGAYFAARRSFLLTDRALRAGQWIEKGHCISDMVDGNGKMPMTCQDEVMGLIGCGVIGQRIAELGRALGMKVVIADRKGAEIVRSGRLAFQSVLKQSTVLVLILPRTPESSNLISTNELKMMRQDAVMVNVSRGGIVNELALVEALKDRQIAGAAVDVFLNEPAGPATTVLLSDEAKGLNLTLTPHTAWVAETTLRDLQSITKENVETWIAGEPVNTVV